MDLGLEGTAAVVGGASSGMGLAIAGALAAEGCAVTMLARTPDKLEQAAAGIPGAIAVPGDVRDQGATGQAVGRRGRSVTGAHASGPPAAPWRNAAGSTSSSTTPAARHRGRSSRPRPRPGRR